MEVIKLNKTHRLQWQGYTHAMRFNILDRKTRRFINHLSEKYGYNSQKWTYYRSRKGRPFWIGFKDEKLLTFNILIYSSM